MGDMREIGVYDIPSLSVGFPGLMIGLIRQALQMIQMGMIRDLNDKFRTTRYVR